MNEISGVFEVVLLALDGVQPIPLFHVAFASVLGFIALDQVAALVENIVDKEQDFSKARGLGVTDKMLERLNLSLLMFCLFAFYGMVSSFIGVSDKSESARFADIAINITLIVGVVAPLLFNGLNLLFRGTFKFQRFMWQVRQLAKRGVKFTNLGTTSIAIVFKYELAGVSIIKPAISAVTSIY
jgi:hypothetical protein